MAAIRVISASRDALLHDTCLTLLAPVIEPENCTVVLQELEHWQGLSIPEQVRTNLWASLRASW